MELPISLLLLQAVNNGGTLQQIGMLLYHLAAKMKVQISQFIPVIVEYIAANKIDSQQRIDGKY
jgi:glutaminyl-tRNA synthetase